jgi:hypothetical protein
MTYTIKGKQYTEFDINKRCAELHLPCDYAVNENDKSIDLIGVQTWLGAHGEPDERTVKYGSFDPCNDWNDAGPIIEKCWDELMIINNVIFNKGVYSCETEWNQLMYKHNCTKLTAACICLIELNE